MQLLFNIPNDSELAIVKKHIADFKLDDTDLQKEQFVVVSIESGLVGFGRLRSYDGVTELCTVGVLQKVQKKYIGKELVQQLLKQTKETVYVVSVIPDFFEKCGFKIVNDYPPAIKNKLNFCFNKWTGWSRDEYKVLKYQ